MWACRRRRLKKVQSLRYLIYSIFIVQIVCYLLDNQAEEDNAESRSRDTTVLHANCDGNGPRRVTIESDLAVIVLVQLDHHLCNV